MTAPAEPIGVGFVGAGPVVQAIHLPTLRRLTGRFVVTNVFDVDATLAARVAEPWGATPSATIDALLDDPTVDVVAVCSPHGFHAEQAIAACRAGKRAVLVEKPLSTTVEQAWRVAETARATGTPVFVGAMHQYDPGWTRSRLSRAALGTPTFIRSSIVLPPNTVFEDFATEIADRPAPAPGVPRAADVLRGGLLGLAIHDLPLIRELVPADAETTVLSARVIPPSGYSVTFAAGPVLVQLHAQTPAPGGPSWSLTVDYPAGRAETFFTPSYVHAGSATAHIHEGPTVRTIGPAPWNGYEGEWRAVWEVLNGHAEPPTVTDLVADLAFAIAVADGAASAADASSGSEVYA